MNHSRNRKAALIGLFIVSLLLSAFVRSDVETPRSYEPCDPVFSVGAGAYEEGSFPLELSAPEGYAIYYTTDSSLPTTGSTLYTEPILVQSPGMREDDLAAPGNAELQLIQPEYHIFQNRKLPSAMIVRAIAVAPDGTVGNVVTQTFFPGLDLKERFYDTVVISLATDDSNLLDYETGIMVKGRIWDEWLLTEEARGIILQKQYWEAEGNYSQHGREWERPVSLEIFDGDTVIQDDAGIRILGGYSRTLAQRSFSVFFRSEYGTGSLEYELIPSASDINGDPIQKYKSFLLRNGGNAGREVLFRDIMLQELLSGLNMDCQAGCPAVVFLNGEYWGVYTLCEKYGKTYIAEHYPGIDKDNVVVIKNAGLEEGEEEDLALYRELTAFAEKDLADPAIWAQFTEQMDVRSMAEYYAAQIYIANKDWREDQNTELWRTRTPKNANPFDDGRWRFMLYDAEYSAALYSQEITSASHDSFQDARINHPLFDAAMNNPDFQQLFLDAIREIGSGVLSPESVNAKMDEYVRLWKPLMEDHYRRFDKIQPLWGGNVQKIRSFFDQRYDLILHYVEEGIHAMEEQNKTA